MSRVDLESLARRAAACPQWPKPGMLVVPVGSPAARAYRITAVDSDGRMCGVEDGCVSSPQTWGLDGMDGFAGMDPAEWTPDLSDPATIGCLLALVREKWAIPTLAPVCKGGAWMFWAGDLPDALYALRAASEVELLVAALEVPRG